MWRGSFQPPAAGGTRQHVESFSSLAIRLLGWYYQARAAGTDRVGAWRKRVRKDAGTHRAVTPALGSLLRAQYDDRRPPHVVLSLRGKLTLDRASLAKSCSAIFVKDLIFLGWTSPGRQAQLREMLG